MIRRFVMVIGGALVASGLAIAAEQGKGATSDPSPEQRHKMAEIHQQMADCLVSERPFAECKGMMHAHRSEMGAEGCSMMDSKAHGGMMGGSGNEQDDHDAHGAHEKPGE